MYTAEKSVFVVENDAGCDRRAWVSTDDDQRAEAFTRQLRPAGRNRRRPRDRDFGIFSWPVNWPRLELKPVVIDAHEVRRKGSGLSRRAIAATRWSCAKACAADFTAR